MDTHSNQEQAARLGDLMRNAGLSCLVLGDARNLAWLFGVRTHVAITGGPCFLAIITAGARLPQIEVLTTANEVDRLVETEFAQLDHPEDLALRVLPWADDLWTHAPAGHGVGTDVASPARRDLTAELARTRRILTAGQIHHLGVLADEATTIVEGVARQARPGDLASELAGATSGALVAAGLEPVVLLVGADAALQTHRHPLPRPVPVMERGMISVGVRSSRGLCTSVTRYFTFGAPEARLADDFNRLLEVEAAFLDATRPGNTLDEVLAAGRAAYLGCGLGPDAVHRHHQGGLGGFAPRELVAGRDESCALQPGMVAAWNPTAVGWKCEVIALVTTDGCQVPPPGTGWPARQVHGRARPYFLIL